MSIKTLRNDRRSPKRRKLDHSSAEENSDLPDDLDGSMDATVRAPNGNTNEGARGNGHIEQSYHATNPRSRQPTASKPAVLPTGGINKSALLALQLTDLVSEVTPDYDRLRPRWSQISDRLVSLIKDIPQRPPLTATEATKSFRQQGIRVPWAQPQPTKETNYKFEFIPPKHVVIGGALPQGLSLKTENVIDLAAIIPNDILQEKDYLNNRAFHKIAFYITHIAEAIKNDTGAEFDVTFAHMHDVDLLPIVKVVSKYPKLSKFTFRIFAALPSGSIPLEKTLPNRNCLRQLTSGGSAAEDQATPFYNSAISFAASVSTNDSRVRAAISSSPAFAETCRVSQLWLRQRGFSSSISSGGFGADEWSIMCTLLLGKGGHQDRPLFSKQYSSLQMFKAMLQVLAGRDLRKQPMLLPGAAKFELPHSEIPVFYDGVTGINMLYKMSPWSYQSLRHHAQVSLAALNSKKFDGFDATFVIDVAVPLLRYDDIYSLRIPGGLVGGPVERRQFLHKFHDVLVKGLGDRVSLIDFKLPPMSGWDLTQKSNNDNEGFELGIALLTIPDTLTRLVDHGPSADEQDAAAEFRQFWGEKAELRRFKDGSISEALVWTPGTSVTLQIIQHLALLHFKLSPSSVKLKTQDFESTILKDDKRSTHVSLKDAFRLIDSTFQTLTSSLHSLEDLPLPLRSISPASPILRSTSTLHPLLPSTTTPIDILIQFDSSTRWPDSLPAIQHTKIAFLLKLSDILNSTPSSTITTTRVGLENTESATSGHFNTSFLDIIYPSPAPGLSPICFRARIHHDRELHLLQLALQDTSLHGSVRDSLALATAAHKRDFQAKTLHTLTMRNLITKFPTLGPTIRLLKTWFAAHLLAVHVAEEILEIIAAHVFLQPLPFSTPGGSSTTAFLRCLHFLARWDWMATPLIVDLSVAQDGISESERTEMGLRVEAWRKLDPNMQNVCWVVGTSADSSGTMWTQGGRPSRVVAGRITSLARAAVGAIEGRGWGGLDERIGKGLFVGSLEDYDFVIRLKSTVVRGGLEAKKGKGRNGTTHDHDDNGDFKNLHVAETLDVDSIGCDPVDLYRQDLTRAFGNAALFFYGGYGGGNVIAGLWRPHVLGRKEWRVRLGWSSVPVPAEEREEEGQAGEAKQMCVFNTEGVVAEMARLGEGLVGSITVKER